MQYIVLDLEWNQPWPGSPSSKKKLPVEIHGEIIQIGAVRMLQDQTVADEFQILVRPRYYRRLNKRVSSLTGIKESRLKAEGVSFPEALRQFRAWCGEDCMELSGIEATRPAHDALGDAYHTALVCARLDLARGCREYEQALKAHENGFHGSQPEGCLDRRVFHGYADKDSVMRDMGGKENRCPQCDRLMKAGRWYPQPGRRYMNMSACPEHGKFLVRIRLSLDPDGSLRVSRLI